MSDAIEKIIIYGLLPLVGYLWIKNDKKNDEQDAAIKKIEKHSYTIMGEKDVENLIENAVLKLQNQNLTWQGDIKQALIRIETELLAYKQDKHILQNNFAAATSIIEEQTKALDKAERLTNILEDKLRLHDK